MGKYRYHNWMSEKDTHERHLDEAGITDKEFRKLYLRFRRRINTCWNVRDRYDNETEVFYRPMDQAAELLERFNGGGWGQSYMKEEEAEFWNEWKAVCAASGTDPQCDINDFLA